MKLLLIVAAAAGLIATVVASKAALGWTLNESVQHYGGPVRGPLLDEDGIGRTFYLFKVKSCSIGAFYLNGTISRVIYTQKTALEDSIFGLSCLVTLPRWFGFRLWNQSENGWVAQANCKSNVGLNLMP